MANRVIMPKQGLQMTEGTIIKWFIEEGSEVKEGTPLFEMETDKLTIQIDAPASGKLLKIVRQEDETVPITELIAIIGEEGEDFSNLLNKNEHQSAPEQTDVPKVAKDENQKIFEVVTNSKRIFISPRAKMIAQQNGVDFSKVLGTGQQGYIIEKDIKNYIEYSAKGTPLAKKLASMNDVEINQLQGSGSRNKIVKEDILKYVAEKNRGTTDSEGVIIPFAGMRKIISERMVESLHTAAQATHHIKVDMSEASSLKASFKKADKRVSYNDIIAFSVCRSLIDYPIMNSELTEQGILLKDYVNLGIAVAVENGLIVPVIKDAELMTIEEIGIMTRELATKAKNGQLKPDEYKGGSFTISNLGMFGLDAFTAIINRPESGILAVGKIEKASVVIHDEIVIRPMMVLTLTYDHRVVDGAPAAQFLAAVKKYLEQPYLLL